MPSSLKRAILGRPLTTAAEKHERLGRVSGLAVFASDALSSVAYGTEEILLVLVAAGTGAALGYSLPIMVGIVILVSDLYDDPSRVMEGLRRLSYQGNDVIVFHLVDPVELDFDLAGSARLVDMETRAEMHVVPELLKPEYTRIFRDQVSNYEKECQKERIDYALLDTALPLDHALFTYLLRRERLY